MSDVKITVCYAVTHDAEWARRAAASAYSAVRANPGEVCIRIAEVDGGKYPWGIRSAVLPGPECGTPWVLMLDADTWVYGKLGHLFAPLIGDPFDIYMRVGSAWTGKKIDHRKWFNILDFFGLRRVPVYNFALLLCKAEVSAVLRDELPIWMAAIRGCGLPDPLMRFKGKPAWWMRDQFALAALVAKHNWTVRELTAAEWSWDWKKEKPGIVHHLGKDPDPFEEEQWPAYVKT